MSVLFLADFYVLSWNSFDLYWMSIPEDIGWFLTYIVQAYVIGLYSLRG